jgi:hypothetical protein
MVTIHSGCISGGLPWVVLFAYFVAAVMSTGTNPPAFVYSIFFIYFVVFNIFALNMVLQYKGVGRWKDYLYGERVYIILSFVAKTILAWLVLSEYLHLSRMQPTPIFWFENPQNIRVY